METLRTALQPLRPITNNLPTPIRDLGVSIIGETCYKTLILDLDPTDPECLKLAISKGLGIGIIGASSIVKVPQILKLVQSQSASGISFLSYLLETSSYLISLAYNVRNGFPFSTFGETALILGQNVIITVLVLNYSGRMSVAALFVAALAAGVVTLFNGGILDMRTLSYLQAGAGVLGVASKVPQIAAIYQQGGTGQLSAFTVSESYGLESGFLLELGISERLPSCTCSTLILSAVSSCSQPKNFLLSLLDRLTRHQIKLTLSCRCSTTLPARSLESSQRCKRWTIS